MSVITDHVSNFRQDGHKAIGTGGSWNICKALAEGQAAYRLSKAGVDMLSECLATEWTAHYIRVNAIASSTANFTTGEVLTVDGGLTLH